MATDKDTVYVDIDDEITAIIDKVRSSPAAIVALVLPKRATMLQSSVNMKLLNKAADSTKKRVVLITSEAGLLPLASSIGMYVAKTLQSKPEIPTSELNGDDAEIEEIVASDEKPPAKEFDTDAAAGTAVGELAGTAAVAGALPVAKTAKPELMPRPIPREKADDADDEVELDNTDKAEEAEDEATTGAAAADGKKAGKKIKVPNFERFRLRLILAVVLFIVLIVGFILANIILPKATIAISTNTSKVNSSQTLNLNPAAKTLDPTQLTIPTTVQQTQKASSGQVSTTGQQNNGQKAAGSATLVNCNNSAVTIPAGTGVSGGGLTYITQQVIALNPGNFDSHGNCKTTGLQASSGTVNTVAQAGGTKYNTSFSSGSVANYSNVSASGSASGGTDDIIQTVTQTDIDNATAKLSAPDTGPIKTALQTSLQQAGLDVLASTFNASTPAITQSANVGDQATTVTVTQTITYTMLGVHQSDLQKLVDTNVNSQIDTTKQSILDDGVKTATVTVLTNSGAAGAQITYQTTAIIGPKLNVATIKQQIAGKKTGDVQSIINADPGVTNVSVHYSPFWVNSVPKHINKITIQIKKSS